MTADKTLHATVLAVANDINDPCSVASGLSLGLSEMGLIPGVRINEGAEGAEVAITLRLTAPGCLYYVYFERELNERIGQLKGVASVVVSRDASYDWTEQDIAASARERMRTQRAHRLAEARAAQSAPPSRLPLGRLGEKRS